MSNAPVLFTAETAVLDRPSPLASTPEAFALRMVTSWIWVDAVSPVAVTAVGCPLAMMVAVANDRTQLRVAEYPPKRLTPLAKVTASLYSPSEISTAVRLRATAAAMPPAMVSFGAPRVPGFESLPVFETNTELRSLPSIMSQSAS
jgi:hypothetical protein